MEVGEKIVGHVVVGRLDGDNCIEEMHRRIHPAGSTGAENGVHPIPVDENLGRERGVHLADSTVERYHLDRTDVALVKGEHGVPGEANPLDMREKGGELVIRGTENSDLFHRAISQVRNGDRLSGPR